MTTAEHQSPREMLTVDEVAEYLRVSRATICRWCGSGNLPAFRIGKSWRVQKKDLDNYVYQQRIVGTATSIHENTPQPILPAGGDSQSVYTP